MRSKTFAGKQIPPDDRQKRLKELASHPDVVRRAQASEAAMQPCTCSPERGICDRHWRKFNLSAFLRDRTEIGMRKEKR